MQSGSPMQNFENRLIAHTLRRYTNTFFLLGKEIDSLT